MSRLRTGAIVAVTVLAYASWLGAVLAKYLFLRETGALELSELLDTIFWSAAFVGLPAVGALVAIRRPANPVGWTILAFGAGLYLVILPSGLAELAMAVDGHVDGTLLWITALLNATNPLLILAMVHLLLFFPNGELDGRSRWLSRGSVALTAVIVPIRLIRPGRLDLQVDVQNPLGQAWMPAGESVVAPLTTAMIAVGFLALVRLVVRYRRAGATERKQYQWILASLATLPVLFSVGIALEEGLQGRLIGQFVTIGAFDIAFLGFAFALYRAITKEDLYGIDRVVSRTLTYAALTAVLVGLYLGLVVGLGAAARGITGESGDLVVALSTLGVAALFQPVRRRIQAAVDRRFNRARYDAARTFDAFGRNLRDEVSLDAIVGGLRSTTAATFQPASIAVTVVGASAEAGTS